MNSFYLKIQFFKYKFFFVFALDKNLSKYSCFNKTPPVQNRQERKTKKKKIENKTNPQTYIYHTVNWIELKDERKKQQI